MYRLQVRLHSTPFVQAYTRDAPRLDLDVSDLSLASHLITSPALWPHGPNETERLFIGEHRVCLSLVNARLEHTHGEVAKPMTT